MKKIILSLSMIAVVAIVVAGATGAFFSDTETSTGNTFTAGTIDIAVGGENPWTATGDYVFADMKPSQVEYSNFTINNVGTNPVNVWKKVDVGITNGGVAYGTASSEPECLEQGGTWATGQCTGGQERSNIDTAITYDLSVKLKNPSQVVVWEQTLYNMNKTIFQITGQGTFLGMVPEGWSMDVVESYHMLDSTTNWAQGDVMPFGITLTGEQLKGTAILEDKDLSNWRILGDTARKGTLTYGVKDSKFNYSFNAVSMTPSVSYSLIAYHEPFSIPAGGPGGFPRPVTIIGSAIASGSGVVTIPQTSVELGMNLLNMPVWLVKTSDLNLGNSTIVGWNPSEILFDTGLIDYYDSDL